MALIERSNRMTLVIYALILAISLGPRIPLGFAIPGRTFDLRVEDIIIALAVFGWFIHLLVRPRIYLTPLRSSMGAYVLVLVITTLIALLLQTTTFIRVFFYIAKELEYFLIFLFVANWVRSRSSLRSVSIALLVAGLLNVGWVAYQMVTGDTGPLLALDVPDGAYVKSSRFAFYGTTLIGETAPFATGTFFALVSYLAFAYYFSVPRRNTLATWLLLGMGLAFVAASILAGTRLTIVFLVIGLAVLPVLWRRGANIALLGAAALIVVVAMSVLLENTAAGRAFAFSSYPSGIIDSRLPTWKAALPYGYDYFLTGMGRGLRYLGPEQEVWFEEAHNHYLRVFIGSGIFGIITFLWLLFAVGSMAVSTFRNSTSAISRVISSAALCALLGLSVAALVQDAFSPVLVNEIFWILVGLTAAAYRIEGVRFKLGSRQAVTRAPGYIEGTTRPADAL